ncbi:hypothetical protein WJX72_008434 [[Myrmecia] bisecta]|uniref:Uncharacterized protein n=1 Tax=[Myrmecia] bisecta TaxID=41462 RepID=A0AAW1Q4C5_9CHLO
MFGLASRSPGPVAVNPHPSLAPVKIPHCPQSPISHPELAFSPTDMGCGLWERRKDMKRNEMGTGDVSTGPAGGRGWF